MQTNLLRNPRGSLSVIWSGFYERFLAQVRDGRSVGVFR